MISRIGKYEIKSEIGCGAFGRVYRAYDPQMRRDVAVKVLIAEGDRELLARFRAEAGTAGNLKHKNIVTVYEYDDDNGRPFIAMELLDGQNLHQIISSQAQLSLLEKVSIILQMAEGLACAHECHVVHRDIKPANVMVLRNQDVKIMDFGIARVTAEGATRQTQQGYVVGTILYMAPERISGADADIRTDIFSFGLVCYELLTGKHPFEASDYAVLLYKITACEVPPLLETIPGCPEVLEYALQRAMAKDREMRYQSMDEILLDLRMALRELSEQRSSALLEQAEECVRSQDPCHALETIRQALKLDPGNRRARSLHESLLKEQHRREVRTKVESLLHSGRLQLKGKDYVQAIQCFESALRLDATDIEAKSLLSETKAALEGSRLAGRLLSEARREMLTGNLDGALGLASDAVQADPANVTAKQLLDKVQQQIEIQNRRSRAEKGVSRAKGLLAHGDFAGARRALAEIREDAEPDNLAELNARIDADEAEHTALVREMRVREGIANASQQIQQNRLKDAEATLRHLLEECPDSVSALKLLAEVEEQREAVRRKETIQKITQEAQALIQSQHFNAACEVLGEGLKSFPDDFSMHRLLERAAELQRALERSQAIQKAIEEARGLQKQDRLHEALALIQRTVAEHGHDTTLTDLKRQLDFELEQQLYLAGLNQALTSGRNLLEKGEFAEAVAALETAACSYPGQPDLLAMLASARQAKAEQQERQLVEETTRNFEKLARDQRWEEACRAVESGLQNYPYNADLLGLAKRAREGSRQHQRWENITRRVAMITETITAGDLARAEVALRLARQDFPGESAFQPLDKMFRQAQTEADIRVLGDKVRHHLERNDLAGAASELEAAVSLSNQPQWHALRQEIERRQVRQNALGAARERAEQGDFQGAEQLLAELGRQHPKDPALAELNARVRTLRSAKAREESIQRGLEAIEVLLRRKDFAAALKATKNLDSELGSDPRITQLLGRIEVEEQVAERDQEVRRAIEQAVHLRAAGRHDDAELLLRPLERFDTRAATLLAEIASERHTRLQQLKQQICELLEKGDAQAALAALITGARDFPEEPEWPALRAAAEERGEICRILAAIRDLELRRQYDAALERADTALQRMPGNPELLRATQRLQSLRRNEMEDLEKTVRFSPDQDGVRRATDQRDAERQNAGIDSLQQTLNWELEQWQTPEAKEVPRQGQQEFSGEKELHQERKERIRSESKKQEPIEIQEIATRVEGLLQTGDLESARLVLAAALGASPGAPALLSLDQRLAAVGQESSSAVGEAAAPEAQHPVMRKRRMAAAASLGGVLLFGALTWHFVGSRPSILVLETASLAESEAGAAYVADLLASGGSPPYRWKTSGNTLPPGLSLQANQGRISGSPSAGGEFPLSIQVEDAKGHTASKRFTLVVKTASVVTPPPPPPPPVDRGQLGPPLQVKSAALLPHGKVGQPYSAVLTAGGGKAPYRWAIIRRGLTPGLQLDAATGLITGTPSTAGTFDFPARISDASQQGVVKTFQIVIEPQDIKVTPPPPPSFACPAADDPKFTFEGYGGSRSGLIEWRGQHTTSSVVVITNKRASTGSITSGSRALEGAPVRISIVPANTDVVEWPSKRNGWSCVAFKPGTDSVTVKWEVDWSKR